MAQFIRYTEHGGPEVLTPVEGPVPDPPAGGVVVEVRAAGVNPVDSKIRSGRRGTRDFSRPQGLGADAAGVVVAVADGVDAVRPGDEVIVHGASGAYASHVVATPDQLVPKPAELSFEQGAALGIPAGTAYQVLRSLGLREGETLLLHAGSGGVGQAAIQFARTFGARVVATASPANHDRLRELGAVAVAYGPGLVDRLREAAPDGYDVALDGAGTDEAIEASLELVPDRDRVATIVRMADAADLGIRTWSGAIPSTMGPEEVRLRAEGVAEAARLAAEGRFEVEISGRYPLAEAADAQRESEDGHVRGKLVLVP
ncbi:Quinone oxidoreductase 1 [Agromyces sp. NDB4Y10]|uniref:quinone oxidoreductase family protein n=1 Tax=Agromyces sp. NDB4Y10 TaxID=1775951 RepID=UPI0007B25755|nr:NADP-dependent oxidoreductase [Agromyces sp. NDB4Y10]KZE94465.1 Quinone oxidoreductase 1 [Agromyces sp. NDB4Y10]